VLGEILPQRLPRPGAAAAGVTALGSQALGPQPGRPIAESPDRALIALAGTLKSWRVTPSGSEGFGRAEVTRGGIDTSGLSSRTMQANEVPGLYVIGEAVDVTGWLGGYNFQWAWSSGFCAGEAA